MGRGELVDCMNLPKRDSAGRVAGVGALRVSQAVEKRELNVCVCVVGVVGVVGSCAG